VRIAGLFDRPARQGSPDDGRWIGSPSSGVEFGWGRSLDPHDEHDEANGRRSAYEKA